jgi:hypothetical protein
MIFLSIRCSILIYKYGYVMGDTRRCGKFSVFVAKSTRSKYYHQVLFTKRPEIREIFSIVKSFIRVPSF